MIGRTLSQYRVTAPLGAGGTGEVYRAADTKLGRDVAIKVLPSEVAGDPERLARFRREAQLLAALNHRNVAAIHGLQEADGTPFLALELVPGEDLAERVKRGPLPLEEALDVATQVAEALEAAHEKGIVHRDLKPANVKNFYATLRGYESYDNGPPTSGAPTSDYGITFALGWSF